MRNSAQNMRYTYGRMLDWDQEFVNVHSQAKSAAYLDTRAQMVFSHNAVPYTAYLEE